MRWNRESSAALISAGISAFLSGMQIFLSSISGSLALMADAFHSGSDVLVSLLVFIGIRISTRENVSSSARIKIENIIAIFISLLIWFAAFTIIKEAINKESTEIKYLSIAIIGSFISLIITYFLSHYKISVGKLTNSPSLIADGAHSMTDLFSSFAVFISLIAYMIGFKLDNIVAIIISVIIFFIGFSIMRDALFFLFFNSSTEKRKSNFLYLTTFKWAKQYRNIILKIFLLALIIYYFTTGIYMVGPGEQALVQRFGRIVHQGIGPGLHYRWPSPLENETKVDIQRIRRLEIGFRTMETFEGEPAAYLWETGHQQGRYQKNYDEALMLTGDQYIVDINLVIHYMVVDIVDYLFQNSDPVVMIRAAAESAARYVVAEKEMETLLTEERCLVEQQIQGGMQRFLDRRSLGMKVIKVDVSEIHPPIEVVPAFRSVSNARQDRDKYIRQAESYYNSIIPESRANAEKILCEATTYKISKINKAEGDSKLFLKRLSAFEDTSDITGDRLYLETMEKVLPRMNKFILQPGGSMDVLDLRSYLTIGEKEKK